jgi:hypothetical protein
MLRILQILMLPLAGEYSYYVYIKQLRKHNDDPIKHFDAEYEKYSSLG